MYGLAGGRASFETRYALLRMTGIERMAYALSPVGENK